MKIVVTRLDVQGRYETLITRDDKVRFRIHGVAHMRALPHDVAHLVVEGTLNLEDGFWGTIASGAEFPSMTWLAGRRRPKAAERSRTVLKRNARALVEAEILVSVIEAAVARRLAPGSPVLHRLLDKRLAGSPRLRQRIGGGEIEAMLAAYEAAMRRWRRVQTGKTIELAWAPEVA